MPATPSAITPSLWQSALGGGTAIPPNAVRGKDELLCSEHPRSGKYDDRTRALDMSDDDYSGLIKRISLGW